MPGGGDGTFGEALPNFSLPANTINVYAEDINGDGKLDLVCATETAGAAGQANPVISASVLIGNGDGTFKSAMTTQVGTAANLTSNYATFAFGDFNNDGFGDIATPFGILPGVGNGTFGNPIALPFGGASASTQLPAAPYLAVGDFNGDGNLDLATLPVGANNGQLQLFLGNGKGAFTASAPLTVGTAGITSLAAADLNGDGLTDLLVGNAASSTTTGAATGASVGVLLNGGNATFAAPATYAVGGTPISVSAVEFNADGNPDLLAIDQATNTANGITSASIAAVLLATKQAGLTPQIFLRLRPTPW